MALTPRQPRLLVVGGSGFIGGRIAARALDLGWDVTSLGLREPPALENPERLHTLRADLVRGILPRDLPNPAFDFVVNAGGYVNHAKFFDGGRDVVRAHFDGVLSLLEAVNKSSLRRFVQIGSSDEYGNAPSPQKETMREHPISPYSLAKTASTHFLQMLSSTEEFPAVVLRLFLAYGPGQGNSRFLPQLIEGCLAGRAFDVSEGLQTRDFCFVDDVVDAVFLAMESDVANGTVLNIASGEPRRLRDVVDEVVKLVGGGSPQFGRIPYRKGENMSLYADISAARETLGWSPKTPLDVGLKKTIDWIKQCRRSAS